MSSFFGLFGPPNVEELKAKKNVRGLINALNVKYDADMRRNAALALGELKNPQAIKALLNILTQTFVSLPRSSFYAEGVVDQQRRLRKSCAAALQSIGWEPKNDIQRALYTIGNEDWAEAVRLGAMGRIYLTWKDDGFRKYNLDFDQYPFFKKLPSLEDYKSLFPPEILTSQDSADFIVDFVWDIAILGSYGPSRDTILSSGNPSDLLDYWGTVKAGAIKLTISTIKQPSSKPLTSESFFGSNPDQQFMVTKGKAEVKIGVYLPDSQTIKNYLNVLLDTFIRIEIPTPSY